MESVGCVGRIRDCEKIRVDGFFDDAGPGDRVGHDDVFDLGDIFWGRGGDLFVGTIVRNEGGLEDGCATETADEGCELRAVLVSYPSDRVVW